MELQLGLPGDWPVDQHRHAPRVPAGEDLESVLAWVRAVEINAWISTTRHCPPISRHMSRIPTGATAP
jgi:hypothetical protein